jgi:hypothetical protein
MHNFTLAIILPLGTEPSEIDEVVGRLMAPYYERLPVPVYKRHLSAPQVAWIVGEYHCDPLDLSTCVPYIPYCMDVYGYSSGIDKNGLYGWTETNPHDHWSSYEVVTHNRSPLGSANDGGSASSAGDDAPSYESYITMPVRHIEYAGPFGAYLTPGGNWLATISWWDTFCQTPQESRPGEAPPREWCVVDAEMLLTYFDHTMLLVRCYGV